MDKFADVACLYGEFRQPAMFGKGTPSTKDFEFLRRVARSGQLNVKPWTKHPPRSHQPRAAQGGYSVAPCSKPPRLVFHNVFSQDSRLGNAGWKGVLGRRMRDAVFSTVPCL